MQPFLRHQIAYIIFLLEFALSWNFIRAGNFLAVSSYDYCHYFLGGFLTCKYMELFCGLVILLSLKRVKCLSVQEFAWIVVSGFHNFSMINKLILLFLMIFAFTVLAPCIRCFVMWNLL